MKYLFLMSFIIFFCSCDLFDAKDSNIKKQNDEFLLLTDTLNFRSPIFNTDTTIFFNKVVEIKEGYESNLQSGRISYIAEAKSNLTHQETLEFIQYCLTYSKIVCSKKDQRIDEICKSSYFGSVLKEVLKSNSALNGKWS